MATATSAKAVSTMTPVNPRQLKAILARTVPSRRPVLVSSSPGVGKTQIITSAAQLAGADIILTHPVVQSPIDARGMPWVYESKGEAIAKFIPFGDLKKMMAAKKLTVVFIDDLGQGTQAVQAAWMQFVLAREIDGHKLSDNVVFIAATNRRTDRSGVTGLLESLKSRFVTSLELQTNLKDWSEWANTEVAPDVCNIEPAIVAFLTFQQEHLLDFKPSADMTNSPSPRGWEFVTQTMRCWDDSRVPLDLQIPLFTGTVGKVAGDAFIAFLRTWESMVSPDAILASPGTAEIPDEMSTMYAISIAIARKVQKESMGRFCQYLERLIAANKGRFSALALQTALTRDPRLTNTQGYIKAATGPIGQLLIGT